MSKQNNDSELSPCSQMRYSAIQKIMHNPTLRVWLYAFIHETCHVDDASCIMRDSRLDYRTLQYIGASLRGEMKNESLKLTHKAEEEYEKLMYEQELWYSNALKKEENPFDNGEN